MTYPSSKSGREGRRDASPDSGGQLASVQTHRRIVQRQGSNRFADFPASIRASDAQSAARNCPAGNVLYLIWRNPWMTISPDTYISAMLRTVNLHHVRTRSDARYPEIQFNDAAWKEADLILLSSEPFPFKDKHATELLENVPCTEGKIRFIDGEMTSWYGSRAIEGLTYLTKFAQDINH